MKLICVVDNSVAPSARLWGEHGLAFLIEGEGGRILWDTGASGTVLLHNLAQLDIAPHSISMLALSHGHYDHTGGVSALLDQRPALPIYAHPSVTHERFSSKGGVLNSIGMPLGADALAARAELRFSRDPQELAAGVWTTGQIRARPEPEGRGEGHVVRQGETLQPDPYEDDMALVLRGAEGLTLLCGCCHAGLLNTLYHVQATFGEFPSTIIGGTHLMAADAAGLTHIIEALKRLGVRRIYPNHCTGQQAFVRLAMALGDTVVACPAGTMLSV
jgi:7,8-dihydropterin-6-yl-methyl-4-(beta-D-ribofuranosyl)aminobenzene 5'-phosphate synthase